MAKAFASKGAEINFFDPIASENFKALMDSDSITKGKVHSYDNKYDCLNGCDGLILITEWREFRAPDFGEIKDRLKTPIIFDARNLYPTETVIEAGLDYMGLGKQVKKR